TTECEPNSKTVISVLVQCKEWPSAGTGGRVLRRIGRRAAPALIANPPVEPRPVQSGDHCRGGSLDLPGVRLAGLHDLFWQPVCGQQQTGRLFVTAGGGEHGSDQPSYRFDKTRLRGVTAYDPHAALDPA